MTIPKQPRTKAAAKASEGSPAAAPPQAEADADADIGRRLQEASAGAIQAINAAYLTAHREQVAAYLNFLGTMTESASGMAVPPPAPAAAPADAAGAIDAHRNYVLAQVDQQVTGQKALLEGASAYAQTLKDIQDRLEESVREQNQAVADALKDALVKAEVRPENVQSLAMLYQGLRTMGA